MSKAYEEELLKKREELLRKVKRLSDPDCKHCCGKGILTFVVGQIAHLRRDIIRTCKCVHKNLSRLDDIKKGRFKDAKDWELKDRVINVKRKENKWIKHTIQTQK